MDSKSFLPARVPALEARFLAQKIAFGPVVFQAVRIARDAGILKAIEETGETGCTTASIANKVGMSPYGVTIVCETALSAGVVDLKEGAYVLTAVGHFLLNDDMTRANMDFVNDVCYDAMAHLEEAVREGTPAGLKEFGTWPTIYQALSSLPPKAQEAWFRFDHIYSDSAFPDLVKQIAAKAPAKILDIGGNTGKWAMLCAKSMPSTHITIADLPGQLSMAQKNVDKAGLSRQVDFFEANMLDATQALPQGFDIVWMSQFLCCFSEPEIVRIVKKAAQALNETGHIYILDTFWDRQKYDIAAYCIINTSPYFTCLANGNSRMYRLDTMQECLQAAELKVEEVTDNLGLGHTLLKVRRQ